jgi:hypothetical protein
MMSKLSEALAAMDKATPGPWNKPYYDDYPGDRGWWIHNGEKGADEYAVAVTFEGNPKAEHDAIVLAAAPDALAWIKEALPLMEKLIEPIDEYLGTVAGGDVNYFHEQLDLYERTKALIARAKPEEVWK